MDAQTAAPIAQDPQQAPQPMPEANDNVQEIVKKRLAQANEKHQRDLDAERAQRAQAEQERDALRAHMQGQQISPPPEEMIHVSQIPDVLKSLAETEDKNRRFENVHQRVTAAAEQDPELKELLKSTNPNGIHPNDVALMGKLGDLPNLPAVVKKLLKDKTENTIFNSAPNEFEKTKYLRDLSEKLDGRSDSKQKFVPAEPINGSSPASGDYSRFVDKYKGRNRRK
jgi:hypothetical protein